MTAEFDLEEFFFSVDLMVDPNDDFNRSLSMVLVDLNLDEMRFIRLMHWNSGFECRSGSSRIDSGKFSDEEGCVNLIHAGTEIET